MASINKLTARTVAAQNRPGLYADGLNLYLQVAKGGSKTWLFRYMLDGRARKMGLGSVHTIPLAMARELATDYRRLLLKGIDPIDQRKTARAERRASASGGLTFAEASERYIDANKLAWKNAKHRAQWTSTLTRFAHPAFGTKDVRSIDVADVLKALEPIWVDKTETASRLRGRIETVLDWATARKLREGENPARWKGNLDHILPPPRKIAKVQHHPALPYAEIATFMRDLAAREGTAARALEFVILTACRTSEVLNARWDEIDRDAAVWTVPAGRMKAGRAHRVPLTPYAMHILDACLREPGNPYVFIGARSGKPLSNMALLALLKRMGREDLTVHGFRSTFRDWASEETSHPNEVVEMALAHTIKSDVEAAYRRGDLLEKRRLLMVGWESVM